jgi:hypothetical protein
MVNVRGDISRQLNSRGLHAGLPVAHRALMCPESIVFHNAIAKLASPTRRERVEPWRNRADGATRSSDLKEVLRQGAPGRAGD